MNRLPATLSALAVLLTASLALGQDVNKYNQALAAYNADQFTQAAQLFYELAENSQEADTRRKSEYYLAQSFLNAGLPTTALVYFSTIVDAGKEHPFYLKAVEGLVDVQARLDDQNLVPNKLNNSYDAEAWGKLPKEVQARINLMIGNIARRKAKFEEARIFLEAVAPENAVYGQARYLLGVVLADPRFPGREDPEVAKQLNRAALDAFQAVANLKDARQVGLKNVRELALLGLGRLHYGMGEFQKATEAYERIPRFSRFWDVALFENGFARFQNDDYGGALGTLQALYAPQFEGAFQPESRVLTATVYYFACLYDESKRSLADYERIYLPMRQALLPLVEGEGKEPTAYYELLLNGEKTLPRPVLLWVRSNERVRDVFANLEQVDREKATIAGTPEWRGGQMAATLQGYLDQNRTVLTQVAGTLVRDRLVEAARNIKTYMDQANIIRFETSNAEKELAEAGVDQAGLLKTKRIFRPRVPAEDWNYWRFQGEFWRDEIGYYQYTLKNGCLPPSKDVSERDDNEQL
jgi:tetratricopeptide (TPR) repeat protein